MNGGFEDIEFIASLMESDYDGLSQDDTFVPPSRVDYGEYDSEDYLSDFEVSFEELDIKKYLPQNARRWLSMSDVWVNVSYICDVHWSNAPSEPNVGLKAGMTNFYADNVTIGNMEMMIFKDELLPTDTIVRENDSSYYIAPDDDLKKAALTAFKKDDDIQSHVIDMAIEYL